MFVTRRQFLATAAAGAVIRPGFAAAESLTKFRSLVEAMKPGDWLELPGTLIGDVLSKRADAPNDGATDGPPATFYSWSGAAYDPTGHRWYFTGGGHSDYSGNEVYAFDFETLSWERLTRPSPIVVKGDLSSQANVQTADGTPLAAHSYDGFVFCPLTRTIFMWQGSLYPSGAMSNDVWEFDPGARSWKLVLTHPDKWQAGPPSAKWSAKHRKFIVFVVGRAQWFDPATQRYSPDSGYYGYTDAGTGAIDDAGDAYYFLQDNILKVDLSKAVPAMAVPLVAGRAGSRPPNIDAILNFNHGFAWDPKRQRLVLWDGGAGINSFDPKTAQFASFPAQGPAPDPANSHVYSKWIYMPDFDVFAGYDNLAQGVWIWKPAAQAGSAVTGALGGIIVTNADGSGAQSFNTLSQAAATLKDGQRIKIKSGDHTDGAIILANNIAITGEAGAHLRDRPQDGGTGILVIKGNDCSVEDLEISGGVGSGDTAAIRFQGKNLTLRRCHLHHCNMNFLSAGDSGDILMEDCVFEDTVHQEQYSHNIYVAGNSKGVATSFTLRRSASLRANGYGHLVKSRALKTTIEDCTLAMLEAESSRCIDIPDGGAVVIRNNVMEVGPKADNNDAIGIALEYSGDLRNHYNALAIQQDGAWITNPARTNSTLIENNIIINDREGYAHNEGVVTLAHSRSPADTMVKNNLFVTNHRRAQIGNQDGGDGQVIDGGGNTLPVNRADASLAPYPFLPPLPKG